MSIIIDNAILTINFLNNTIRFKNYTGRFKEEDTESLLNDDTVKQKTKKYYNYPSSYYYEITFLDTIIKLYKNHNPTIIRKELIHLIENHMFDELRNRMRGSCHSNPDNVEEDLDLKDMFELDFDEDTIQEYYMFWRNTGLNGYLTDDEDDIEVKRLIGLQT